MPTSAGSNPEKTNRTAGVDISMESLPGVPGPVDRAMKAVGEAMDYIPDQVSSRVAEFAGKHGVNEYLTAAAATPLYLAADPLNLVGGDAAKAAPKLVEQAGRAAGLAMDQGSRLKRAAEMGFDTAKKWYHGTAADIKEFKPGMGADPEELLWGPGHYFTSKPNIAGEYAENAGGTAAETLASGLGREEAFKKAEQLSKEHGLTYADPVKKNKLSVQTQGNAYAVQGYLSPQANVIPAHLKKGEYFPVEETIRPGQYAGIIDAAGLHGTPDAMALTVGKPNGIKGGELYRFLNESAGLSKSEINAALKKAGYDGITHEGGKVMGKEKHQVMVVFDPANIRSPQAAFDPAKEKSRNILASVGAAIAGGAAATQGDKDAESGSY